MQQQGQTGEERFIDAEEHSYGDPTMSYDAIVLNQIRECVKVLSKDPMQTTESTSDKGVKQKSLQLYDEEFNHVDTLKRLMRPFLKGDDLNNVLNIYKQIFSYEDKIMNTRMMVQGSGYKTVKEIGGLATDHPLNRRLSVFKSDRARDLFETLVVIYQNKKMEIAAMGIEQS